VSTSTSEKKILAIKPPNIARAEFTILGNIPGSPLVLHRFSAKTKLQMKQKMETGKPASSKKNREAQDTDELFEAARYRSKVQSGDWWFSTTIENRLYVLYTR